MLGAAAAVLLFGLMLLTTADVVGRYIFNWPLRGAFEVTELLLLALIFAGLPLVSRADEHVTLDFIDRLLGATRAPAAAPADRSRLRASSSWPRLAGLDQGRQDLPAYGDTTDVLRIRVGPFVYFMAVDGRGHRRRPSRAR